jgi:hypothetical protein
LAIRSSISATSPWCVLAEHPVGVAAENLLGAPGDRVERARTLRALFGLADGGRIRVTGKAHRTEVAGAVVYPGSGGRSVNGRIEPLPESV